MKLLAIAVVLFFALSLLRSWGNETSIFYEAGREAKYHQLQFMQGWKGESYEASGSPFRYVSEDAGKK